MNIKLRPHDLTSINSLILRGYTVEAIAEQYKVTRGTIYRHFPGGKPKTPKPPEVATAERKAAKKAAAKEVSTAKKAAKKAAAKGAPRRKDMAAIRRRKSA